MFPRPPREEKPLGSVDVPATPSTSNNCDVVLAKDEDVRELAIQVGKDIKSLSEKANASSNHDVSGKFEKVWGVVEIPLMWKEDNLSYPDDYVIDTALGSTLENINSHNVFQKIEIKGADSVLNSTYRIGIRFKEDFLGFNKGEEYYQNFTSLGSSSYRDLKNTMLYILNYEDSEAYYRWINSLSEENQKLAWEGKNFSEQDLDEINEFFQGFSYSLSGLDTVFIKDNNQVNAIIDPAKFFSNLNIRKKYFDKVEFFVELYYEGIAKQESSNTEEIPPKEPELPIQANDIGLAKDYSGSGWYKATDTGIVFNKGVPEGETHIFEGDPKEYISVYTKEDAVRFAERAATSNITDMSSMFADTSFNQPIGHWDVSNVTNMSHMFYYSLFNQPIGHWDVSNVTDMNFMLAYTPFNQPIGHWDVSSVNNMDSMFYYSSFNQPIGQWNVSSVTDMNNMFAHTPFNQVISEWNVSNVANMSYMFAESSFNQDISNWCVAQFPEEPEYFADESSLAPENYPVWGTCPRGEDQSA